VEDFAPHQLFLIVASSCVFFYMFFLSISLIPPLHRSALSILHGLALVMLVPISLGFTYVQSVLLLTVAFYELRAPSKEPHYNDFSCLVHLPVSLVGWVEGMGCESFVRGIGESEPQLDPEHSTFLSKLCSSVISTNYPNRLRRWPRDIRCRHPPGNHGVCRQKKDDCE
jgi:hypothetical protein